MSVLARLVAAAAGIVIVNAIAAFENGVRAFIEERFLEKVGANTVDGAARLAHESGYKEAAMPSANKSGSGTREKRSYSPGRR